MPPPPPGLLKRNNHVLLKPEESIAPNYPILFLVHGAKETVKILPKTYSELKAIAIKWTKAAVGTPLSLRVPARWASGAAARIVHGEYVWLCDEESYRLAKKDVRKLRVEVVNVNPPAVRPNPPVVHNPPAVKHAPGVNYAPIVNHAPVVNHVPAVKHVHAVPAAHNPHAVYHPPVAHQPVVGHPHKIHHSSPLPSVHEMKAAFTLERSRGKTVTIDTICKSNNLDMSRADGGAIVDGTFKGKLDIIHNFPGHVHRMEFNGTRFKPSPAKCTITIMSPRRQLCDVMIGPSIWEIGATFPLAEQLPNGKLKFSVRINPNGSMEHFASGIVTNALYYEAIPDPFDIVPDDIEPRNGFAMKTRDFILHIEKVLRSLRLPTPVRTSFIINQMPNITAHKYIAYRFMSPRRIDTAIEVSVTHSPTVWSRIFLIYRGISVDEFIVFCRAGRNDVSPHTWKEVCGLTEISGDEQEFRVVETSVLEID